ncbi:RNA-dependent RNA polymerase 1 [Caerostris extrusa]|uniref:RNA-dependent RNA polymerase n=1 Tax=Caerostris extrusa TaxID=172846 RepID=A0AAV4MDS1_CAEEX|nr:RNA-dependent RNA polymerase 1 [Caerostris extrusa]
MDAIKSFLQEKCKQKPNALCRAFYYIFEVISNGNVINFFECLKYLYELLQNEEAFVVTEGFSNGKISEVSQMLLIKRAIFTPTHLCLLPPQPILKSRALRDCNPNYSLRISIKDINMDSISYSTKSYSSNSMELQKKFFNKYYKSTLLNGLHIGKRNYKYVGSSSSQLKSHGLWFYAKDSENKTANDLRKQFGSFEKICNVPKYMARMGQTFSQSLGYIEIPQEWTNVKSPDPDIEGGITIYLTFSNSKSDVKKLLKGEDVEMQDAMPDPCKPQSENFEPYTFSDGVGRISKELAEEIYKKFDVEDQKPSAMQIRYAGCKGMLVMDPRLEGKTIKFRKSMKKFDSDHTYLEILKFSEKRACFLNRPLITILEQLGISKEIFLKLQKEMVQKHISSMFHEWDAYHFLNRHALLRIDFLHIYTAEIHFTEDPLFRSMIYALFQKQLDLLKE